KVSIMQLLNYRFFFCQAEDGIRDRNVTGVQTCALPISFLLAEKRRQKESRRKRKQSGNALRFCPTHKNSSFLKLNRAPRIRRKRSEERRVGKEMKWRMDTYIEREANKRKRRKT